MGDPRRRDARRRREGRRFWPAVRYDLILLLKGAVFLLVCDGSVYMLLMYGFFSFLYIAGAFNFIKNWVEEMRQQPQLEAHLQRLRDDMARRADGVEAERADLNQ